jgi:hypothetical protein
LVLAAQTQQHSITLPVGTEIAIRTVDRIDSKSAKLNRDYAATLDDPIVVDGVTVVPANSNAFVQITDNNGLGIHVALLYLFPW